MNKLLTGIFLLICGFTYQVRAAVINIDSMTITGGNFSIRSTGMELPDGPYNVLSGTITPLVMGIYQGGIDSGYLANIETGNYFLPTYAFTSTEADIWGNSHDVPTGTVDTSSGTVQVDLRSWTIDIDLGYEIVSLNAGGIANGIYDPSTGAYSINWIGHHCTNFCDGETFWNLEGVITLVPVPGAFWLFSSGILGLIGLLRHRRVIA